jgi:hypothetical protein
VVSVSRFLGVMSLTVNEKCRSETDLEISVLLGVVPVAGE